MNRKYLFLFSTATIAIIFIFVYFGSKKEDAGRADKIVLGITQQPGSDLAILALKKGIFRDLNLDVEVKKYPTGKVALYDGLLNGKVDVIMSAEFPVVHAIMQQQPVKIIASIATSSNINRIVARADNGIRSAHDLVGKKIGTQQNSAVHFFLSLFLKENGIKEESVNILFMEAKELPEALAARNIDAFAMREPYVSKAKELLGDKIIVFESPSLYIQAELLLTSDNFINQNRESTNKLLKALLIAEEFARKEPKEAMSIVATEIGVPQESYSSIYGELNLRVRVDQSLIMLLENEARWMMSHGTTTSKSIPNLLNHINYSLLEGLKPEAVTVIK